MIASVRILWILILNVRRHFVKFVILSILVDLFVDCYCLFVGRVRRIYRSRLAPRLV